MYNWLQLLKMNQYGKYEPIRYRTDLLKYLPILLIRYTDIVKWLPYTAIVSKFTSITLHTYLHWLYV